MNKLWLLILLSTSCAYIQIEAMNEEEEVELERRETHPTEGSSRKKQWKGFRESRSENNNDNHSDNESGQSDNKYSLDDSTLENSVAGWAKHFQGIAWPELNIRAAMLTVTNKMLTDKIITLRKENKKNKKLYTQLQDQNKKCWTSGQVAGAAATALIVGAGLGAGAFYCYQKSKSGV